jgi:hypothetical protein
MLSDRESVKFYLVLWHGKIQTHKPNTSRASGRACMLRAWHGIHNAGGEAVVEDAGAGVEECAPYAVNPSISLYGTHGSTSNGSFFSRGRSVRAVRLDHCTPVPVRRSMELARSSRRAAAYARPQRQNHHQARWTVTVVVGFVENRKRTRTCRANHRKRRTNYCRHYYLAS